VNSIDGVVIWKWCDSQPQSTAGGFERYSAPSRSAGDSVSSLGVRCDMASAEVDVGAKVADGSTEACASAPTSGSHDSSFYV
jgi:hypothetical protein